jgi:hypothetical protein
LLFSGSHGVECTFDDTRQPEAQGAIVCQDWDGFGKIQEEHWFAGSDLPTDAKLHGVEVPMRRLGNLWVARDDARNFMTLGDPAVRLRVEDMPQILNR